MVNDLFKAEFVARLEDLLKTALKGQHRVVGNRS